MTFEELTTPFNLIWPPIVFTIMVIGSKYVIRKIKGIQSPIQPLVVVRTYIYGGMALS